VGRRAKPSRFRRSDRHSYRLELVLQFGEPVAAHDAGQMARRITDAIRVSAVDEDVLAGLENCQLICHEMRKVIPLEPRAGEGAPGPAEGDQTHEPGHQ